MEDGDVYAKYYRCGSELLTCNTYQTLGKCTYFTDGHGNISRLTVREFEMNPTGALIEDYEYDAYGNQQKALVNMVTNPFQYCGEYIDLCSGLIYLRNRYYDPSIGRFISEDPVKDGLNWYVYCNNDPVNAWDPSGLKSKGEIVSMGVGSTIDILSLQLFLNANGYTNSKGETLSVDGQFGSDTEYAVRQYQKANSLTVDGLVGDATWSSMGFEFDSILGNKYATMALQSYLNGCGYTDVDGNLLVVDGIYGNNTKYAVSQYQIENGLEADGIVGTVTMAATRKGFVPRKDPRRGSETRQPTGSRERNVGHPAGEEHSRVPKGNGNQKSNGVYRAEGMNEAATAVGITAGVLMLLEMIPLILAF